MDAERKDSNGGVWETLKSGCWLTVFKKSLGTDKSAFRAFIWASKFSAFVASPNNYVSTVWTRK